MRSPATIESKSPTPVTVQGVVQPSRVLSRRLSLTLGTTLVGQAANLVSGACLARLLGVEGRGYYAAIILWPILLTYAGDLGGPIAYTFMSATRPHAIPGLLRNLGLLVPLQSLLLIGLGIPVVWFGLSRYPVLIPLGLAFLVTYVPISLTSRYLQAMNQGERRFGWYNAGRFILNAIYAIGIGFLFAMHVRQLVYVVGVYLASNLALAVVVLAAQLRRFTRRRQEGGLGRAIFAYGIRAYVGNLNPITTFQPDLAAVVLTLGAASAGLYAVAASAASVIGSQGSAFGTVALPMVASASNRAQKVRTAGTIFRLGLLFEVAVAGTIALMAPLVIRFIYGGAFVAAAPLVRLIMIGAVAAAARQILADCLRGFGRPLASTVSEVSGLVVAVAALVLLVPILRLPGAALALDAGYVTTLAVAVVAAQRSGVTLNELFMPRRSDLLMLRPIYRSLVPTRGAGKGEMPKAERKLSDTGIRKMRPGAWRSSPRVMMAAAVVALVTGMAIVLARPTLDWVLIGLIGATLCVPVMVNLLRGNGDIFAPLVLTNAFLGYCFVLRPAIDLTSGTASILGYDARPTFDQALLVALVAIAALQIGYALPLGRRLAAVLPAPPGSLSELRARAVAVILTGMGAALFAVLVVSVGGLGSVLSGGGAAVDRAYLSSTAYLSEAPLLAVPASLILLAIALTRRGGKTWALVLMGLDASLVLAEVLPRGGRTGFLLLVLPLGIFWFLARRRRPRLISLLIIGYVGFTVAGSVPQTRFATATGQSVPSALLGALTDPGLAASNWLLGLDGSEFDLLAVELQTVPSTLPYKHGAALTDLAIRAVPRPLWPDKPLERNDALNQTLFPSIYGNLRVTFLPTLIGTLYMDSGVVSAVIGMVGVGILLAGLWSYFRRHRDSLGAQLLYASSLPLVLTSVRDTPAEGVAEALFLVVPVLILLRVAGPAAWGG